MIDTSPSGAASVQPRLAATLLIIREGKRGAEILMGRRSARHRFMPNSLVFPGGALDDDDFHAPIASPFPDHVCRLIDRDNERRIAHALGAAMARELEEETGLSLGRPPALGNVDVMCRAITPSIRPKRFDAWFFVVPADNVAGAITESDELSEIRYFALHEALSGELEFATRGALDQLRVWLSLGDDQRALRRTLPTMREKVWRDE